MTTFSKFALLLSVIVPALTLGATEEKGIGAFGRKFEQCSVFHGWHQTLCYAMTAQATGVPCNTLGGEEAQDMCWGMVVQRDPLLETLGKKCIPLGGASNAFGDGWNVAAIAGMNPYVGVGQALIGEFRRLESWGKKEIRDLTLLVALLAYKSSETRVTPQKPSEVFEEFRLKSIRINDLETEVLDVFATIPRPDKRLEVTFENPRSYPLAFEISNIQFVDGALGLDQKTSFPSLLEKYGLELVHQTRIENLAEIMGAGKMRLGKEFDQQKDREMASNVYFQLFPINLRHEGFVNAAQSDEAIPSEIGWLVLKPRFFVDLRPRFHVNDGWLSGYYYQNRSALPESPFRMDVLLREITEKQHRALAESEPWTLQSNEVVIHQEVDLRYIEAIQVSREGYDRLVRMLSVEAVGRWPIVVLDEQVSKKGCSGCFSRALQRCTAKLPCRSAR